MNAFVQVGADHYDFKYDTKERFISYWHQINEIIREKPSKCLEIGVGNGFVSDYLTRFGLDVITLDINMDLEQDIIGDVKYLPFNNNSFDLVSCCEVLEHLPYEYFETTLKELYRVSRKTVLISLPDASKSFQFGFTLPKKGFIGIMFDLPRLSRRSHRFDGQHYWEIGKRGYNKEEIVNAMKSSGFNIIRQFRIFENPYHHFFILEKNRDGRFESYI